MSDPHSFEKVFKFRKLIENFDKHYIPAIVQSNIDGAKQSGRQIGRTMSSKASGV